MLRIATDATFDEATKTAGIAAVFLRSDGTPYLVTGKRVPCGTNNAAEFLAILMAVEAISTDGEKVRIFTDSQNCSLQLAGKKKANGEDLELVRKIIRRCKQRNLDCRFVWKPRTDNQVADAVAYASALGEDNLWARVVEN